jgi:hypothetical protein
VDVGSFTRVYFLLFYIASPEYFGYTLVFLSDVELTVLIYALFNEADNSLNYCVEWLHNQCIINWIKVAQISGGRAVLMAKFCIWWRLIFMVSLYVTCLMSQF